MTGAAQLTIRSAGPHDLASLLALYRALNPADPVLAPDTADARYHALLSHPGLHVFLGLSADVPVSTATLLVIPNLTRNARPYGLIENVVTLSAFRGKGYARAVLRHAVAHAFAADCYKVMLLTGRQRPDVLGFYESCGFAQNKTGFQIRND
jgi:GNAT superfamily N-acetyltransferase